MVEPTDFFIDGRAGKLSLRALGLDDAARRIVVLVQGANMSGQMGYDFRFDGRDDYSFMAALAARGFAPLTFAVRGYAASGLNHDPFAVHTEQAIEDLASVLAWLKQAGHPAPHLVGWSWGGRIVARHVAAAPDAADRLVLLDPALGGGNLVLPAPTEPWWSNTQDYFYGRLEPQWTEEAARIALGARMQAEEPRSPNGIRQENAQGSTPSVASAITRPTLMLYGEGAGMQNYMQGALTPAGFFGELATTDKALFIIPDGGDYAHLQHARQRLFRVVADFLQGG
jgi:pimeloyl-ACP methyl ester carboxylesterase